MIQDMTSTVADMDSSSSADSEESLEIQEFVENNIGIDL